MAVEESLSDVLDRIEGLVNVPAAPDGDACGAAPLQKIRLHAARPAATNQPTAEGVSGAEQMMQLVSGASSEDVVLCLFSGGGSALLPLPVEGVTLADKQQVTKLLHACGATINEMNAVRKHLSRIKGGRLAQACQAQSLFSLIISDVIGDPLDVIASGPTAPDPTTFADALAVLDRYNLLNQVAPSVFQCLQRGQRGDVPESPKALPDTVHNVIIGNNQRALRAAQATAKQLGYRVLNLGSCLEGETREVGVVLAGLVRSIHQDGWPLVPPVCVLSGGETTVTLTKDHGRGGRNQELVLALAHKLGVTGMAGIAVLSGGTDGEDGPTDAAGAVADVETLQRAAQLGLNAADFLKRNDAYAFFERTGGLIKTGLTQTNVMDVRVLLVT
jgi:hydroxypyruvate reductase/glycerate 2-kinase